MTLRNDFYLVRSHRSAIHAEVAQMPDVHAVIRKIAKVLNRDGAAAHFGKPRSEPRYFAFGLFSRGLVLKHVPVFLKSPVPESHDVGSKL